MIGFPTAEFGSAFEERFPDGDADMEGLLSPIGADVDELDVLEVQLGVAVIWKDPMSPPVSFDTSLEASAGLMVRVVGGNMMVAPGVRKTVTVAVLPPFVELLDVELPLSEEEVDVSVPFEVMLDVSPPSAPVAPIRDRAFASLVHARNVPLLVTEGTAKHSLSPPGHVWVCHAPFEHSAERPEMHAVSPVLQASVTFKVWNSALSCWAAWPF